MTLPKWVEEGFIEALPQDVSNLGIQHEYAQLYLMAKSLAVAIEALRKLADNDHMINDCGDLGHSTHCVKCFVREALSEIEKMGEK